MEQMSQAEWEARGEPNAAAPTAPVGQPEPTPYHLLCPACRVEHIDEGEWATRPHKTHQCQSCKHEWRPFEYATVGVASPAANALPETSIIESELDEKLMGDTLLKCYSNKVTGFHVSTEHYRYLVEQIVSLRQHSKRQLAAAQQEIADLQGKVTKLLERAASEQAQKIMVEAELYALQQSQLLGGKK